MKVKSMLVGFLIAVVASTGTYFLVPPPPFVIFPDSIDESRVPISCKIDKDSSEPVNPNPLGLNTPASDSIAST